MKIKLTQIFLAVYLVLISFITGKAQVISLGLFALALVLSIVFFKNKINASIENMAYIAIAFSPFPYLLSIFLVHLPFAVFGLLLVKRGFIKIYVVGFAVSLLPTIVVYTAANYLNVPLNFFIVAAAFYLPAVAAIFVAYKKRKLSELVDIDSRECILAMALLLSAAYVGIAIVNNHSLFLSNGTYLYTKFELIVKSINSYSAFPLYDPAASQGESPFLFESPLVFSHLAFVNILLPFIPQVAFYNAFSLFTLFLATLGLSILIRSALNITKEMFANIRYTLVVAIGSALMGLNFYFVQLLESYKQFFAFPINYIIFSIILDRPQKAKEIMLVLYMIALTFVIHAPHGVGIVLISFSLFVLIIAKMYFSKEIGSVLNWILNNKTKAIAACLVIIFVPSFYVMPTFLFKDFLEENPPINWKNFASSSFSYFKAFLTSNLPLSLKYPDVNRNDDKKFGPFVTVFGLLSVALLIIMWKRAPTNLKFFSGAYILHFFVSSFIVNIPSVGSLEYSYRTAEPYLLILLVMAMCALALIIKNKYAKLLLIAVLFIGFLYTLPLSKKNMENIHKEEFISGRHFAKEIEFAKSLPQDGRVITYGMFANAIDPGMASLTGRYFSRHHLTEVARSRSIYSKIHSSHSFGHTDELLAMSGTELYNYLRLGGYKYIFADIRHPIGAFVVSKLYPNFTYPIYQNQYFVFLVVNGTDYAEKVSVLKNINGSIYKEKDGYKYLTTSVYYKLPDNLKYSRDIANPEKLSFKRAAPTEIEIYGNFEDGDWVTFKEAYFSRWKAYMNGKEVSITSSNHNLILINTIKGDKITLRYSVLPVERFAGVMSLTSSLIILSLFALFV